MGAPKVLPTFFSITPMDASELMKKNIYKCLDILVDFQIAFKICRKTIGTKARRNYRYSSKQNLSWEKNLNKLLVQSLQGLRNEH